MFSRIANFADMQYRIARPDVALKACRALFAISLLLIAYSHAALANDDAYAIRGTVVTSTEVIPYAIVLIVDGRIKAVGSDVELPEGVKPVETNGYIYPGLIDLHNHLTWNIFPRWKPNQEFANRYEWQQKPVYNVLMSAPHAALVDEKLECEMERYAEVKAITEGETALAGSLREDCSRGLARNLDYAPALLPSDSHVKAVEYNVFPLQMEDAERDRILKNMEAGRTTSLLIHLAEGAPDDAASAREFTMLKARKLLRPGVSLIHGVALKPADFTEMAAHGVGLVWSPRSNIELYGATADVVAASKAGVKIAIAPDWSPTGSDGMLAELNYASTWNAAQKPKPFTNRDLFRMATILPAELAGLADAIGSLMPGRAADLLVLKSDGLKSPEKDGYWTLLHSTAADVELVVIGGAPIYGEPALLGTLAGSVKLESLNVCGVTTAISFASTFTQESWVHTTATLDSAMRQWGRTLAPLAECGQ